MRGFFQNIRDDGFMKSLDEVNFYFAKEKKSSLTLDETLAYARALELLGLYEHAAASILRNCSEPQGETAALLEELKKKEVEKKNFININREKNLAALSDYHPLLYKRFRRYVPRRVIAAGDHTRGFRLLNLTENGFEFDCVSENTADMSKDIMMKEIKNALAKKLLLPPPFFLCQFTDIDSIIEISEATAGKFLNNIAFFVAEHRHEVFVAIIGTHDFSVFLRQNKLVLFIGEDLEKQICDFFDRNLFSMIPTAFIFLDEALSKRCMKAVNAAVLAMSDKATRILEENNTYYNNISDEDIRRRFSSEKLRIMIITTTYSTFIQYCARDIACALTQNGEVVKVFIEPNNTYSAAMRIAIMSAVNEFKPDILLQIDHHRYEAGSFMFPSKLVFSTWAQDPMPELYNQDKSSFGRMDFLFTPVIADLLNHGFKREQLHFLPIPAADDIYFPRELTGEELEKFSCDVAYVSHIPSWKTIIDYLPASASETYLFNYIKALLSSDMNALLSDEDYEDAVRRMLHDLNFTLTDNQITQYAMFIRMGNSGRVLPRTIPMEWIAGMGVNLHIYGNRWDEIPALAAFARGSLANGEELSKAYQAAKINISISTNWSMHMRVFECLLSGGFILVKHLPLEKDLLSVHNFFNIGEDLDVFYDRADLESKIDYYLKNPEKRLEMAEKGRRKVLEQFTFKKQMNNMINTMRERLGR